MNVTASGPHKDHAWLIEQCQDIVKLTKALATSNASGNDKRERMVIEELRFQAHATGASLKNLLLLLQRGYQDGPHLLEQEWNQLQETSFILLSDCQELLGLMDRSTMKNKTISGDTGRRSFGYKSPIPFRTVSYSQWTQQDLERIKFLVCYRLVIECLPALNLALSRGMWGHEVGSPAKEFLTRLKDQLCYCKFHPSSFRIVEVPREQNWHSWSDSPDKYFTFVHFAKLAYKICGRDWPIEQSNVSVNTGSALEKVNLKDNQTQMTISTSFHAIGSAQSSQTTMPLQSSYPLESFGTTGQSDMLRTESSDIAIDGAGSSGSGTGAPDEDSTQSATVTRTSSRSTVTASSSPYSDLGQHIQSLLRQQLTQDQKEKEALQQRVSELEERCKLAERRAKDGQECVKGLVSEVNLTRQKLATSQSLLQQRLDRCLEENGSLKTRVNEIHNQLIQSEEKCEQAYKAAEEEKKKVADENLEAMDQYAKSLKEYYESQLSDAQQKIRKTAEELKRTRKQMLQIQDIAKTWKFEKIDRGSSSINLSHGFQKGHLNPFTATVVLSWSVLERPTPTTQTYWNRKVEPSDTFAERSRLGLRQLYTHILPPTTTQRL